MALEAKEIAGGGQKITAEARDYVWLGSGSSGMLLLPDQVHISAADVYMKSPLNWIHKIIDEETTETLLDLYEEMKTSAPFIYAPDGTLIRRDGYDDILYSEELYDYFLNHVVGKEEGYERNHDEPYVTLYEQWLDETYGHSAMWYFWDYVFSIDGLQTMLSIAGIFYYPIHYVNAAIYLLRGDLKKTGKSIVMGVSQKYLTQFIEELAAIGYDGLTVGMTSDDVVTELYFRYLAEENSAKLFAEIGPLSEEMINSMRYTMTGVGIAEGIFYKDLTITAEVVDSEGNVIGKVTTGKNKLPYLKKPVQGGTLNIGAGKRPIENAYNIDINPTVEGVYQGSAMDLNNVAIGSQSKIIMQNPYKYDVLNLEINRVLQNGGIVEISRGLTNGTFKKFYNMSLEKLRELGYEIIFKGKVENTEKGFTTTGKPVESTIFKIILRKIGGG